MARQPEDRTFRSSTAEANRSAEQGNGVGERELQVMKDPGEDIEDLDLAAEAEEEPGLQQGRTGNNRPDRTEAQRSQGRKTLEANRERVKGNPDFNP